MKVLAIETSCDETALALIEGEKRGDTYSFRVLTHALLSQALLHSPYGGVYPNLAKREHIKNLPILFKQFENETYDAIAVTQGPGLEPALWTGITFAEELAKQTQKPLYPINHMEGHLISSLVQHGELTGVQLPVLALLISGGHTEFILMRNWFEYELIGKTLDDAVGEAFDKVARMLNLPYPGGPVISKLAEEHRQNEARQAERGLSSATARELSDFSAEKSRTSRGLVSRSFTLPRPMIQAQTCDMSFSGLKTAALYALRGMELSEDETKAFAREFEDAAADVLVQKTRRALEETGAQTFVVGGGVAANTHIRRVIGEMLKKEFPEVEFRLPDPSITGDNAVMIAEAALARILSGTLEPASTPLTASGNLSLSSGI